MTRNYSLSSRDARQLNDTDRIECMLWYDLFWLWRVAHDNDDDNEHSKMFMRIRVSHCHDFRHLQIYINSLVFFPSVSTCYYFHSYTLAHSRLNKWILLSRMKTIASDASGHTNVCVCASFTRNLVFSRTHFCKGKISDLQCDFFVLMTIYIYTYANMICIAAYFVSLWLHGKMFVEYILLFCIS